MSKLILDTSVLISHWHQSRRNSRSPPTSTAVKRWANELIRDYGNAIVTPVYVEMVAGVMNEQEFHLTLAFLHQFKCVDGGHISSADWKEAIRLAQRVPHNPRPRDRGDCLIRAIANRLKYDVRTFDTGFAR